MGVLYCRGYQLAVGVVVYGCGVDCRDGSNNVVVDMGGGFSGGDRAGAVLSCCVDGDGFGVVVEV